ncbi:hypothetical protein ACFWGD_02110 [Corynebacterium sp. NPDC060344]|uniref:hypothetical protein n=1 Tax=Corynebacterium sp. NPDC060344 TaxID=3347101 RepID=UPI00365B3389
MKNKKRGAGFLRVLKYALLVLATVALVKIAFFPANQTPQHVSSGDFSQPTAVMEKGTINNETKLSATILRDAPTPIRATAAGEVTTVYAASGQPVNAGQGLIQVKTTTMPAGSAGTSGSNAGGNTGGNSGGNSGTDADADSAESAPTPQPVVSYNNIPARAGGTVQLTVVVGQSVEVGQEIGTISPSSFHALAQLKPSQLYSMGDALRSGTLSITDGPGPFLCSEVKVVTASSAATGGAGASGDAASSGAAAGGSGGGPQIRCAIPNDQTVYEGIPATLTIGGATTGEVNTLPVTAVEGRFNEGVVFVPAPDPADKPIKRKVQLGANDGKKIEIKGGLKEGEEVLMFVPANSGAGTGSDSGSDSDSPDADPDADANSDAPAGN